MSRVILSLGSNIEPRGEHVEMMLDGVGRILDQPIRTARLMETEPVEVVSKQPWFMNVIVSGGYEKDVHVLLGECEALERRLGRTGKGARQPRSADVDILVYGKHIVHEENLVIPHPGIRTRRYCLRGIVDVEPELDIPGMGGTAGMILSESDERLKGQVIRFVSPE